MPSAQVGLGRPDMPSQKSATPEVPPLLGVDRRPGVPLVSDTMQAFMAVTLPSARLYTLLSLILVLFAILLFSPMAPTALLRVVIQTVREGYRHCVRRGRGQPPLDRPRFQHPGHRPVHHPANQRGAPSRSRNFLHRQAGPRPVPHPAERSLVHHQAGLTRVRPLARKMPVRPLAGQNARETFGWANARETCVWAYARETYGWAYACVPSGRAYACVPSGRAYACVPSGRAHVRVPRAWAAAHERSLPHRRIRPGRSAAPHGSSRAGGPEVSLCCSAAGLVRACVLWLPRLSRAQCLTLALAFDSDLSLLHRILHLECRLLSAVSQRIRCCPGFNKQAGLGPKRPFRAPDAQR
jgi:hypothetical protein